MFFRQERIGRYGQPFVFIKFRSMYTENDTGVHKEWFRRFVSGQAERHPTNRNGHGSYKLTHDPRVTRVGKFLRRTSLDELPQFINVLKGEMSMVGPRPPIPYEVDAYQSWHRGRILEAKPGITGLWQVNGRSRLAFDDMVRLDLRYARGWSLWLDIRYCCRRQSRRARRRRLLTISLRIQISSSTSTIKDIRCGSDRGFRYYHQL